MVAGRWRVLVVSLALLVAGPLVAQARAADLDAYNAGEGGAQGLAPGQTWAQTFVAGRSGGLTLLRLPIMAVPDEDATTRGDLRFSIRTAADGTVVRANGYDWVDSAVIPRPDDAVLASATIPGASVALFSWDSPTTIDVAFDLPAQVTAGSKYAFVIEVLGGNTRYYWMISNTFDFDGYPAGTILFVGQPGAWYDYGYQVSLEAPPRFGHIYHYDGLFETYVATPSQQVASIGDTVAALDPTPGVGGALTGPTGTVNANRRDVLVDALARAAEWIAAGDFQLARAQLNQVLGKCDGVGMDWVSGPTAVALAAQIRAILATLP